MDARRFTAEKDAWLRSFTGLDPAAGREASDGTASDSLLLRVNDPNPPGGNSPSPGPAQPPPGEERPGTGASAAPRSAGAGGAVPPVTRLPADQVRFSQDSVSYQKTDRATGQAYTYRDLVDSMRQEGWRGDPVDVVRQPDGSLTSLDNTRVRAAREAGVDVQARVRDASEPLTVEEVRRFARRGQPRPGTWGDAVQARIKGQSAGFHTEAPYGSGELPRVSGAPAPPPGPPPAPASAHPAPGGADLPSENAQDILRYRAGGRPGRGMMDEGRAFPQDWNDNRVVGAVRDVAGDPASVRTVEHGHTVVRGERDGVEIEVYMGRDGRTITGASAGPASGPGRRSTEEPERAMRPRAAGLPPTVPLPDIIGEPD